MDWTNYSVQYSWVQYMDIEAFFVYHVAFAIVNVSVNKLRNILIKLYYARSEIVNWFHSDVGNNQLVKLDL